MKPDAYADWRMNEHPNARLLWRHETGQCVKYHDDCPYCDEEAGDDE